MSEVWETFGLHVIHALERIRKVSLGTVLREERGSRRRGGEERNVRRETRSEGGLNGSRVAT
jgi:hypothetical protein